MRGLVLVAAVVVVAACPPSLSIEGARCNAAPPRCPVGYVCGANDLCTAANGGTAGGVGGGNAGGTAGGAAGGNAGGAAGGNAGGAAGGDAGGSAGGDAGGSAGGDGRPCAAPPDSGLEGCLVLDDGGVQWCDAATGIASVSGFTRYEVWNAGLVAAGDFAQTPGEELLIQRKGSVCFGLFRQPGDAGTTLEYAGDYSLVGAELPTKILRARRQSGELDDLIVLREGFASVVSAPHASGHLAQRFETPARDVAIADLTGDGVDDLVFTDGGHLSWLNLQNAGVTDLATNEPFELVAAAGSARSRFAAGGFRMGAGQRLYAYRDTGTGLALGPEPTLTEFPRALTAFQTRDSDFIAAVYLDGGTEGALRLWQFPDDAGVFFSVVPGPVPFAFDSPTAMLAGRFQGDSDFSIAVLGRTSVTRLQFLPDAGWSWTSLQVEAGAMSASTSATSAFDQLFVTGAPLGGMDRGLWLLHP